MNVVNMGKMWPIDFTLRSGSRFVEPVEIKKCIALVEVKSLKKNRTKKNEGNDATKNKMTIIALR